MVPWWPHAADHRRDRGLRHQQERRPLPAHPRHRVPRSRDLRALQGAQSPRPGHHRGTLRRHGGGCAEDRRVRSRLCGEDHPAAAAGLGSSWRERRLRRPAARSADGARRSLGGHMSARRMTILAPEGMLGYGIPVRSMAEGMKRNPDAIAVDAGSTDPGPYYLGAGVPFTNRRAFKRDLGMILDAARERRVPVLIGSAGGGGGTPHLQWTLEVYREICRERGYHFRAAVIGAEVDKGWLKQQIARGRTSPLDLDTPLTHADVDRSVRIVAQMGYEPFMRALDMGAEVVIAGRAYDPAPIGALPMRAGFDTGLVIHMGKILECGGAAAYPRHGSDSLLGFMEEDAFVAAHTLYEKPDPYLLHLPGGAIDLSHTVFEQINPRQVRVSGTRWIKAPAYTLKLEGVRRAGYRTLAIAG